MSPEQTKSPFTGLFCVRHAPESEEEELEVIQPKRPVAVMLAEDAAARPLSGIAAAELVVEMPVVTYGINRFMAVYACPTADDEDFEIGSVRSARDDFIPLAAAFDAVYGHWGGSYLALESLRGGIIDNVDALRNPFGAYYRRYTIPAPHNGFTTLKRMYAAAEQLGYRVELLDDFTPFVHQDTPPLDPPEILTVRVGYFGPFRVEWRYDREARRYLRWRGGTPEIDADTGTQVAAGTVVVMRTEVVQRYGEYNDVRVTGSGEVTVYRYGDAVGGTWEKAEEPLGAPLRFLDEEGNNIAFAPGPV
ncbi:MAG: DUF3048 domain-containing protein, partial [Gemmatimonadetes bacterium]|nr:DUF3048 domain-containing protein [Gemmatimonadota bacterium]